MIKVIIYVFSNKSGTSRKNPPASAGDARVIGLIPGSGQFPGEENGTTLQYSCLENPTDRGTWWATAPGVTKSLQLCQPMPPGDPSALPGSFGSVFCGVTALLLWILVWARFCLCPPRLSPSPMESYSQIPLAFRVIFPRFPVPFQIPRL